MPERSIEFESERQFHKLYGEDPANLLYVEKFLGVKIVARGNLLHMDGDSAKLDLCEEFFCLLQSAKEQGFVHGKFDFLRFLEKVKMGKSQELRDLLKYPLRLQIRKKSVVPRNLGQRRFLDLILKNDLVFGIGPAGTGKTFLAMIAALHALLEGEVERIVLARPAVEAGEALGFLPGDLEEKLLPYLRPLYDAMDEVLGPIEARKLVETGVVEIAPLAYMRGRTLSKCFALLDEAQNTTRSQMMMFLTRLGEGSKMVVTGDLTQVDLPLKQESGLAEAKKILGAVKGLYFHEFDHGDVVRHPLVSRIISAYQGELPSSRKV
ncbi:MAG TPA: phosphate starvation-inducible protein PhoH [Opitutae bacterium]|nr:phosphate starvation-inducible protein PhoH [Opitutae bacterium]HAF59078.1 phosphate starvation-inducible protein PhoH [Opitutae bacterium]|tara:strand:+ start:1289 stop:2254 length:966 start_codon:yes stop_codon:yes gene_type:complete